MRLSWNEVTDRLARSASQLSRSAGQGYARAAAMPAAGQAGVLLGLAVAVIVAQLFAGPAVAAVLTLLLVAGAAGLIIVSARQLTDVEQREARLPQATEMADLDEQFRRRGEQLRDLERQTADAEAWRDRKAEAEQWLNEHEPRLQAVEQQRHARDELAAENDRRRQQIEEQTERAAALTREIGALEGRCEQADHRRQTAEQQLTDLHQQQQTAAGEIESLESRRTQLNSEVADLEDQRRQRNEFRQQVQALTDERDRAQRDRDEQQRQRDRYHDEAERLRKETQGLESRLSDASQQIESLESRRKQLSGEVVDLEDRRRQRDELRQELETLTQQRESTARQRDEAQRRHDHHSAEADRLTRRAEQLQQQVDTASEQVESLEQRKAGLGREVAELEADAKRHETLKHELTEMSDRRASLSEALAADQAKQQQLTEQLEQRREQLAEQQQTVETLRSEQTELTEQRRTLRGEVAELEPTAQRYKDLKQQVDDLNRQAKQLPQQVAAAEAQVADKQHKQQQLDADLEQNRSDLDQLRQQIDALTKQHGALSAEAAESEKLRDRRDQQAGELSSEIERKRETLETTQTHLESQQEQRRTLNEEVEGLAARKAQTEQTIETLEETLKEMRLQQGYRGSNAGPLSELWKPALVADAYTEPSESDEDAALEQMRGHLSQMGLRYADRTLRAFHTSMKVQDLSPLCVLAGLSGTGKSELARRYAEGMGMHFLNLAVQPRWDDPQDLFGFFNYLENQYRPTELARALVQMDPFAGEEGRGWSLPEGWDHSLADRMLVVLLDEMNLAHVEYYFSEFLSRLELRRGINKQDPSDRRQAELALEIGAHGAGDPTLRLFVDANVMFVGTINEDETTRTLSDKVIDRSNIISFGAPQHLQSGGPANASGTGTPARRPHQYLPYADWRQWVRPADALDGEPGKQVEHDLEKLNEAMAKVQRPFGFRTYRAIRAYAANYPEQGEAGLAHAMADQIEQKLLPRFRGMDPTEPAVGEALEGLLALAEQWDDRPLVEAIERSRDEGARQYHFAFLGTDRSREVTPHAVAEDASEHPEPSVR